MNLLATPFARRRPKSPRPVNRLAGQRRHAGLDRGEALERRNLLAILAGGVERTTPDDFFTDFSTGLTSEYTAYTITNDASGPAADVWVKAVFPGGSPVGVGTGYNREDGLYRVGTLPPSTSGTAFLYFTANALSAAPVPYSIEVYDGEPGNGGTLVVTKPFSLTTVVNTLAAEPNKVDTVSYSPASPQIGDTLTLSVTGRLGNGADRVLFAPASGTAWEPDVFELRSTSHTISGVAQTPNGLFYDGLTDLVNQQPFTSTYQFLITRASATATLTSPTQYTQDGEQAWKHHKPDPTPFPTIPPIPPRLTLTKNDGLTTYVPGGTTTYTIVLSNTGAGPATGVVVSDVLPPQLNAAATTWTVSYSNATGTLPANGSGNIGGTVNLAALNGVVTITINGAILSSALGDMTNTVTATVSGTTVTASDTNTAAPLANLTISKTDATTTVTAGGGTIQTYTLRVRNLGLSDARNVVVSDSWPAGFLQGGFGGPSQGTVIPGVGGNFSWSLGTLAAGVEATLTVTYTVPASTLPGDYVNTATVTSTTPDPDPDNTATDTTSVVTSANLSITKTDLVTTVTAGGGTVQTYTLAVRNNGASDARNVVVGDTWPAGFAQGAFGIPSQGTVTPGVGGNFSWSLGTLAAGAEATLTVSYTVPASTLPALYSNTATVTSTTSDPDPTNNTATDTTTVVASANLTVEKTDDTTTVLAGGGTVQTYTLRVRNNGVSDARNVTVNDVWPAGFAQGAFGIPSQGTVTPGVGGNFSWSLGTLAAGAEATLTVSYTVPASTLPGPYVNTATVTSTTPDPDPNNTATDTTTVIASANLTVEKTDDTNTVLAGGGTVQTYTLRVRNNGVSDARNVAVNDVWPAGFAQGAFGIPSQGTVTPGVGGNFSWSLGTLAAGAEATLTVSYTVPASTLPGPYVNTATVTSTTPDPDPNNTATDTTTVVTSANLTIAKTDSTSTVTAGDGTTQTYVIAVRNNGASDAQNVSVADVWPAGFAQGAFGIPSQGTVTPGVGGNFTWSLGTLAAGAEATLTVSYTVPASTLPGPYVNTATVTSTTPDPDPNNTATDTTTVIAMPDLAIMKTDEVAIVTAGGGTTQTYTITVRNNGVSDSRGVVVNDVWPTAFSQGTFGIPSQGTVIPGVAGNFTWTVGTLAAGSQATLTVTYTVAANVLPGPYINTATVTSDDDRQPHTATDTTVVSAVADLIVSKTDSTMTVIAGGGTVQTYVLRVRNGGVSDSQNVVLADTWPAGFTQIAFDAPSQGIVTPGVGGNFTWSIGTLPAGQEATLQVSYVVPASTLPGPYVNTATVSSETFDPDPDNTATDTTTVVASADLTITKDDATTTVLAGGGTVQTYTLTVRNNGASDARDVVVADAWPEGFLQATLGIPTQGTVTPGVAGDFTWTLGTLIVGGQATLTVTYTVPSSTLPGPYVNTATVTSTTPDPDPNNTATDTTTVVTLADLTITKSDGTTTVTAGGGSIQTYILTVRNNGASDAQAVAVEDAWPAGFQQGLFGGPSQGTVVPGVGGNFTWTLGTLIAGGEATLTVTYTVPASTLPGAYVNTATVTSLTPDPDPANTATDTTTVVALADLSITKTDSTATVVAGGGTVQTYTLRVRNNGLGFSDAQDVVVVDSWPAGFTQGVFGIPSQGTVTPGVGGNFTWTLGTLAQDAEATLTVTYTVPASTLPGLYTNTATVTSSTPDPDPNNTATDTTTVIAGVDLTVTKTGDLTYKAGGLLNFVVVVTNLGPSFASGVRVVDALPAGVVSWSWTITFTGAGSGTIGGSPDSATNSTTGIDTLMNLAVLGTATFTISALTQTGFTSDISNTATATIGDESATATWTSAYDGPINPTADVGALVLGTDDGCNLASWVKVIDPVVGATLVEFLAYEPSFLGSVRVATGDLTGDGLDEIVVAPGRNRVGEVRVFTQQGVELPEYRLLPFNSAYLGGVEVAVGDVNGDGFNDIIAGQSSGAGRVSAFLVNPTASDPVANVPYRAFRPFPSPYALGVMIAAGDFGTYSGGVKTSALPDGRAEIVVGTNAGTRAQVRIYDASTATPRLVKTILPFASTFQGGVTLSTGRYNFDAIDDVMIGAGVGGNSAVEVYDGATWALRKKIDAFAAFGRPNAAVFAAMLDLDGDGRADDVYGVQGRNATGGSNGVRRWNRITTATNVLPETTTLAPPLRIASIVLRVPG